MSRSLSNKSNSINFTGLPAEIQTLGNNYARDEFKRHKNCKVEEANIFLTEWTNYAISLSKQLVLKSKQRDKINVGDNLSVDDLKLFKEDQIVQLYELSQAASGQSTEDAVTNGQGDAIPKKS